MVVLNKGDWCLYKGERLCRVIKTGLNITSVYWADVDAYGYADPRKLTPLPEGLNQILSDSIKEDFYET